MYEDLIRDLRDETYIYHFSRDYLQNIMFAAADAIEELQKRVPPVPHGRLIDADALMLEIQEYIEEYGWETDEHGWHNEKWCAMKEAAMVIDAAPTILEAEEGE